MSEMILKGEELYAALRAGDVETLHRLLSPDFRGELAAGMPHGFGRAYEGLETMIGEGWVAIDEYFEISPYPEQVFDGGDVLIASGWYVGVANATAKPVRAAFAHFWPYDGKRFTGVRQVTDTAMWHAALT